MEICVVGAGAAGLMAAIWARRTAPEAQVMLLDGARRLGAKILISGGGRCNVTHTQVDENDFSGSSPMAIRKVLRRFDIEQTLEFFRELGVALKREPTGKLFPTDDRARTVLEALLREATARGVTIAHPRRVEEITALPPLVGAERRRFRVSGEWGSVEADRVVVATGGLSVPKTGSDGAGYTWVRQLGHEVTRLFPGLVPLTLPRGHFLTALRGIAVPVTLELRSGPGKRLAATTGPLLCTHFGVSGPAVLDMSRHYLDALHQDAGVKLHVCWLPRQTPAEIDGALQSLQDLRPAGWLARLLPERLARALCAAAEVPADATGHALPREARRALVNLLTAMHLPVTGSRGFAVAEVTAGGVPLAELRLETMESRRQSGLHLCGEICDVDGRLGGFNFQWAWASGYVAGVGAARSV